MYLVFQKVVKDLSKTTTLHIPAKEMEQALKAATPVKVESAPVIREPEKVPGLTRNAMSTVFDTPKADKPVLKPTR